LHTRLFFANATAKQTAAQNEREAEDEFGVHGNEFVWPLAMPFDLF
jgi:hypothetical protein